MGALMIEVSIPDVGGLPGTCRWLREMLKDSKIVVGKCKEGCPGAFLRFNLDGVKHSITLCFYGRISGYPREPVGFVPRYDFADFDEDGGTDVWYRFGHVHLTEAAQKHFIEQVINPAITALKAEMAKQDQ